MNIHEYQAKELLRKFGVAVPDGQVAYTVDEAVELVKKTKIAKFDESVEVVDTKRAAKDQADDMIESGRQAHEAVVRRGQRGTAEGDVQVGEHDPEHGRTITLRVVMMRWGWVRSLRIGVR